MPALPSQWMLPLCKPYPHGAPVLSVGCKGIWELIGQVALREAQP
jgi:hypothetical protein